MHQLIVFSITVGLDKLKLEFVAAVNIQPFRGSLIDKYFFIKPIS